MKNLLLFVVFIILMNNVHGQCIIINLNLGDCVSCYSNLDKLKYEKTEIPTFFVFEENLREDSIEINQRHKIDNFGGKIIFNDKLFEQTNKEGNSTVVFYLDNNLIVKDLKDIDDEYLSKTIKIMHSQITKKQNSYTEYFFYDTLQVQFNLGTGTIKTNNNTNGISDIYKLVAIKRIEIFANDFRP